jgi:hypothetical protein
MNAVLLFSGGVGFATSLGFIVAGRGLWAIPIGMLARAGVSLGGSLVFLGRIFRRTLLRDFAFRSAIVREFVSVAPATAIGGMSYALMNQSEIVIVAVVAGADRGRGVGISRKAAEVTPRSTGHWIRTPWISHLVGSGDLVRSLDGTQRSWRCVSPHPLPAAGYVAVNKSLVSVWVVDSSAGWLTVLIALHSCSSEGPIF